MEDDNTTVENFEAILLTIDDVIHNGALETLRGNEPKISRNWREIIALSAKDYVPNEEIRKHLDDKDVILELKLLFQNSMKFCAHPSLIDFQSNLHDFNRFLQIKNGDNEE
jgi:hypothetical protein